MRQLALQKLWLTYEVSINGRLAVSYIFYILKTIYFRKEPNTQNDFVDFRMKHATQQFHS